MVKTVVGIVLVVGLLLAADITARAYAESKLQSAVDQHGGPNVRAEADISSFPFLGRLLVQQEVAHVDVHITDLDVSGLTFDHVDVAFSGVDVDRGELLSNQRVRVTGVKTSAVTADVTAASLSTAIGAPVTIADGQVQVEVLGHKVAATVDVVGSRLSLRVAGAQLPSFAVPSTGLLPCIGNADLRDGRIEFKCSVQNVPPGLLDLINGAAKAA